MRKRLILLAALMFIVSLVPISATADEFITLENATTAQVVEIIDVNAIRVRTAVGDGLVRLIGIHDRGTPEAISFLSREIMGQQVILHRDAAFPNVGRWNYMYVSIGPRNINGELILSGYVRLNEGHSRASLYDQIRSGQTIARDAGLGMWVAEVRQPQINYFGVRVNINTATSAEIVQHLEASQAMANAIVNHRSNIVFQHVNDVAFVPAVTRQFFSNNRHRMTVSTNINVATVEEISTLTGISQTTARNIVNSRDNSRFTNIEQLFTRGLMTRSQLNNNTPFISVENIDTIQFARPDFRANINLASHAQLIRAGATSAQAEAIINQRDALTLRHLGDLSDLSSQFSVTQINALSDNMRAFTNINTAPRSEIESLFGANVPATSVTRIINSRPFTHINQIGEYLTAANYNRVAPFIYVENRPTPNLVNINTATQGQLVSAGFSTSDAQRIVNNRPWQRPSQLPGWLTTSMRQNITLRTNINTANNQELFSLDNSMTLDIINRITLERTEQPFSSIAEVETFFREMGQTALFNRIRNFIIVR